jgi:hypothetical protein
MTDPDMAAALQDAIILVSLMLQDDKEAGIDHLMSVLDSTHAVAMLPTLAGLTVALLKEFSKFVNSVAPEAGATPEKIWEQAAQSLSGYTG